MRYSVRHAVVPVTAALAAVTATLFLGQPAFGSSEAATVKVSGTEMKFALNVKSVPKGSVTFLFINKGKVVHDFKIAGKKTPKLASGKSAKLLVRFAKAGKYPFLCTLPGHAAAGMKGSLTVK